MKLYNLESLDETLKRGINQDTLITELRDLLAQHGDTGAMQQYTVAETTVHGLVVSKQPADDWLRRYYGTG